MNPNKLRDMLASGNVEQIKEAQRFLQGKGHYEGTVDGILKSKTGESKTLEAMDAFERADQERKVSERAAEERKDALEAKRLEIEALKAQSGSEQSTAETEALKQATAAKKKYTEQANSPLGVGTTVAAGLPALLAGTYLGSKSGELINQKMDESQAAKNKTLAAAAEDRMKGVTTRKGAVTGTTLAGAMPSSNSFARVAGRMIPHAGLAGIGIGKGASMLASEGEGDPAFYPEMANQAGGIGLIGGGSGVLAQGIKHGVSPGVPPDAKAISIIQSEGLRRNNTPADAPGPKPGSRAALLEEAKKAGITGRHKMNVSQLVQNLAKVKQIASKVPALAGPALAATLAYNLTPKQAEARGGEPSPGPSSAATNAALAGGTAYGVGKLAKALAGSRVGPYLGPAMTGIGTAASAYDYAQEAQEARQSMPQGTEYDMLAQAMPAAQRGGEMVEAWRNLPGQAQEFVQRNQSDPSMGMTDEAQAMPPQAPPQMPPGAPPPQDPMMQANALQIPHDQIQQSQTDMAFDPAMRGGAQQGMELPPEIQQQMQMLMQQGAPPDLIASYLNHIAAQ